VLLGEKPFCRLLGVYYVPPTVSPIGKLRGSLGGKHIAVTTIIYSIVAGPEFRIYETNTGARSNTAACGLDTGAAECHWPYLSDASEVVITPSFGAPERGHALIVRHVLVI